jgi:hypothetical protein
VLANEVRPIDWAPKDEAGKALVKQLLIKKSI